MHAARLSPLFFIGLALVLAADTTSSSPPSARAERTARAGLSALPRQPLRFEENVGQAKSDARFLARRSGASLYLADEGATLLLAAKGKHAELTLAVDGGRKVTPVASAPLASKTNYLVGRDEAKWHPNVPNYGKVTYPNVLDGVDVVYHGEEGQLEYDFVVAPGADVTRVAMDIGGTAKLALTEKGDLQIDVPGGTLVQPKPRVYQRDGRGVAHDVEASYRLKGDRRVGFEVASYDHGRELVIDPIIGYSTYLGENSGIVGVAQDSSGSAYVVGTAPTHDFAPAKDIGGVCTKTPSDARCAPTNLSAFGVTGAVNLDWWSSPDAISYNIYRGAAGPGSEGATPIATGVTSTYYADTAVAYPTTYYYRVEAVTSGGTTSPSGEASAQPTCSNCVVTSSAPPNGSVLVPSNDVFVAKLTDAGAVAYFTYVGGADDEGASAVAIDAQGRAIVVGTTDGATNDFPTTDGSVASGNGDGFVVRLDPTGSSLDFSTLVHANTGCNNPDCTPYSVGLTGVALSGTTAYVSGYQQDSYSECAPATCGEGVLATVPLGGGAPSVLQLGGTTANGVATDGSALYVVGSWTSYPGASVSGIPPTAFMASPAGRGTAFLLKLSLDGDLTPLWGTYFGDPSTSQTSTSTMTGNAVALGAQGQAYITGLATCNVVTPTADAPVGTCALPTRSAFQATMSSANDAYVAHFNTNLSGDASLVYATFLGGGDYDSGASIAVDPLGHAFVTGETSSIDYPVANAPAKSSSDRDAFLTELETTGTSLIFSTTFGGSRDDGANAVSYNATGIVIAGQTWSTEASFPLANAAQSTFSGTSDNSDAFAAKLRFPSALDLQPASSSVGASAPIQFVASGGAGTGYVYSFSVNTSGATIDPSTGAYTSGPNGGTDLVRVTDPLGATAAARVVVTGNPPADLVISPSDATVPPRGTLSFTATGGTPPYSFNFVSNGSNGALSPDGHYVAGARGSVVDTVRVTDQAGVVRQASIRVGPGLAISPNGATVLAGGTIAFVATGGGGGPYQWSAAPGTITATGNYTAPASSTVATVTVRDSLGNEASVNVSVGGALAVTPATTTTYPQGKVHFSALGGSGAGFKWALIKHASGGSIDVASGDYVAGPAGNTQDVVEVTDSNGNKASATVDVGPALTLDPPSASANADSQISFSAAGGSGAGYSFTLVSAPSGGSISASGVYTSGKNGGTDVVQVTDSAGNAAKANVVVAAAPPGGSSGGSSSGTGGGGPAVGNPSVDGGSGGLLVNVGSGGGGGNSCAVSTPGSSSSGAGAFAGLALAVLAAVRRRRRSH